MGVQNTNPLTHLSLPPGFRFYPTDEELLVQYLCRKVAGQNFSLQIIGEIDLYKYDPWVLPSKATFGEKEWYFFSPRDRKYPNGSRPNRVAGSGYWKATGTDKVITTEGRRVGIKKALVFYVGKAPKGTKTNWIMHEYRLSEPSRKTGTTKLDEWVLCRIYKKNSSVDKPIAGVVSKEHSHGGNSSSSSSSQFDDVLDSLPEINDRLFSLPRMNNFQLKSTFQQQDDKLNVQSLTSGNFDWASLAGVGPVPDLTAIGHALPPLTQGHVINANNVFNHEMCVDSISPMGRMDEEVQSEIRTRKTNYPSSIYFHQQNPPNYPSNGSFNSVDPFGSRFPGQLGRFDCRP